MLITVQFYPHTLKDCIKELFHEFVAENKEYIKSVEYWRETDTEESENIVAKFFKGIMESCFRVMPNYINILMNALLKKEDLSRYNLYTETLLYHFSSDCDSGPNLINALDTEFDRHEFAFHEGPLGSMFMIPDPVYKFAEYLTNGLKNNIFDKSSGYVFEIDTESSVA